MHYDYYYYYYYYHHHHHHHHHHYLTPVLNSHGMKKIRCAILLLLRYLKQIGNATW